MPDIAAPRILARLRVFSIVAGGIVVATGAVVLTALFFGISPIQNLSLALGAMKLNTAIGLILTGGAVVYAGWCDRPSRAVASVGILTGLLGLLTLLEYLFTFDLGLDQLLWKDDAPGSPFSPAGRMAPVTAGCFLLFGIALALHRARGWRASVGETAAAGGIAVSFLAVVGYIYGVPALYTVGPYSSIALHTASAFLLLGSGILASESERGFVRFLAGERLGGVMLRRTLPFCILLPVVLGWLRLKGELAGLYTAQFGVALFALAMVFLLTGAIWVTAASLERTELRRRKTEAELSRSEDRFRIAVERSPTAMIMVDKRGMIVLVNAQAEKLFGYTRDELLGRPVELLVPAAFSEGHAKDRQSYVASPEARAMGAGRDLSARRKDGAEVAVEIGLSPFETGEGPMVLGAIVDITERKAVEKVLRDARDELERRVKERTAELTHANEALSGEIEERKEAEARLAMLNRELEAFSYSVSHDLRAPLRHIDGFSQALLEDYGGRLDAGGREYLARVRESSQFMGQLIDDLLNLSRVTRSELVREEVDLSRMAAEVADEIRRVNAGRTVEARLAPGLTASADPRLLRVVLENLLGNAWKYTGKKEKAVVEFGRLEGRNGESPFFVRDNGAGFDMEYSGKLFGAFQRLHSGAEFPGTGIGLATVQRIIHRHGGRVWAEGKVDDGATFYFTLP